VVTLCPPCSRASASNSPGQLCTVELAVGATPHCQGPCQLVPVSS
jgi:hypothetical protein